MGEHNVRPNFARTQVGFNNNLRHNGMEFHIQTEDSGLERPHVITHLFADGGRIIKSHKRVYASELHRDDIVEYVRALMKSQHMEMAMMLRQGRFNEILAGRATGGLEVLETPPATEPQPQSQPQPQHVATKTNDPVATPTTMASARSSLSEPPKRAHFRLNVLRSLAGGPAFYEPTGDSAVLGRAGTIALEGERFCHPQEARLRWQDGRVWLSVSPAGSGVFRRIRRPVEVEPGGELLIGDQLLVVDRHPEPNDGPGPGPTYFYASPKWPSSFRVTQRFEGGSAGACVVARGTTVLIGSAAGDLVFAADPLIDAGHCRIEEQVGSIFVTDLGSRTGVFVRVRGEQELVEGDELIIGRTRLALELIGKRTF